MYPRLQQKVYIELVPITLNNNIILNIVHFEV